MAENCDIERGYILGIDMGTTSVKIVVVDTNEGRVLYEYSKPILDAYIIHNSEYSEQCVQHIIDQLDHSVGNIPPDLAKKITGIGVCGQLHGVVCWSFACKPWITSNSAQSIRVDTGKPITSHYNWQDNRCNSKFLESLPKPDSHLTVHTGYGCCTLFWLSRNSPASLESMNRASTIADFVVSMLCDLTTPKMSTQSAASWGYFNTETNQWNKEILETHGFPVNMLPEIVQPGSMAGTLKNSWHNIRAGIPVGAALGDLQSSIFAILKDDNCAICNISTSAQLVFVAKNFHPSSGEQEKTVAKIVPYFDGRYLFEAALLNGGNAVSLFVKNLHQFVSSFNSVDDDDNVDSLWTKLIEEAITTETDLDFSPLLLGERFSPDTRGSISNIKIDNFSIPQIFKAMCRGVIVNIHNIVSQEKLKEKRITKILATGSALLRNKVLQMEMEKYYHPLPIEYTESADAPMGAALSLRRTLARKIVKT